MMLFDKPEWVFQVPPESTPEDHYALIEVIVAEEGKEDREVTVLIPTALPKFLFDMKYIKDVSGPAREWGIEFLLEEELDLKRWYMALGLDDTWIDLYYYTPSTLPVWAKG